MLVRQGRQRGTCVLLDRSSSGGQCFSRRSRRCLFGQFPMSQYQRRELLLLLRQAWNQTSRCLLQDRSGGALHFSKYRRGNLLWAVDIKFFSSVELNNFFLQGGQLSFLGLSLASSQLPAIWSSQRKSRTCRSVNEGGVLLRKCTLLQSNRKGTAGRSMKGHTTKHGPIHQRHPTTRMMRPPPAPLVGILTYYCIDAATTTHSKLCRRCSWEMSVIL